VLQLMAELQEELGIAYLFISHDLAVVEQISHRVAVMYLGEIVETGSRTQVFENPGHAYTALLLAAAPVPDPMLRRRRPQLPIGDMPSPVRDLRYRPMKRSLVELEQGHFVSAT
jgi:ABC-type oligopeptide transport system ATPase subunit